jgi:hypothetical protein
VREREVTGRKGERGSKAEMGERKITVGERERGK